jgi:hypothetical protein
MQRPAHQQTLDDAQAVRVLDNVSASRSATLPHQPGRLEIVRLLRELRSSDVPGIPGAVELVYAARPASKRSQVHAVHFIFAPADQPVPASSLDVATASIHLYYGLHELEGVRGTLRSRKDRFCYFWQTSDGTRMRAWLFTPR